MSTAAEKRLTVQEYLAIERAAETKSEFFDGEMFAMAGASRRHNLITLNTGAEARLQLKGRRCEVYTNDMRVKISATGLYTYPNIVVVCGEPEFEDAELDTLLNPTVLMEVLSESTEDYDRGRKLTHYRKIPSLREYLLISQDEHLVEQFLRQSDGRWLLSEFRGLEATVSLPSIDCRLPLAEVYDKVELDH